MAGGVDDWKTVEKRQLIIRRIGEAVRAFPDVLSRTPNEVEEAIFVRAKTKDDYMNTVGKVLLSIKQKGQNQMMPSSGMHHGGNMMGSQQPVGNGMMGGPMMSRPAMHPAGYPPYQPGGVHMGGPRTHHMTVGPMHPGMNMMHPSGYNRMPMQPGQGMMPGPHHMMNIGHPMSVRPGINPAAYANRGMMPPGGGGMPPPRMQVGPNISMVGPDGVQSVTAYPNPSFPFHGGGNMVEPRMSMGPSHFGGNASPYQQHQNGPTSNVPPTSTNQYPQAPSPAPRSLGQVPSPQVPIPSPNTPWNPNSPAHAGSPSQPVVPPEANAAVLNKLQELQPYVPLLARMIDRLEKTLNDGDKTKNDQYVKLNSLLNVIQSKNMKVPLSTLEKCHTALKGLFRKELSANAPAPGSTGVPVTISNEPSVTTPSTPPRPPVPPTPPISLLSRDLHDFKSLSSPPPLSSNLEPTFCPDEDPLDRLPPEKKAKLDEQADKNFFLGLKRELIRLKNFKVKQIQEENGKMDGSVTLECTLVADGLPSVPSIKIHVPRQYPNTSPECLIPNYKSEDCSDLVKELGKRLLDELAQHSGKYTLTYILQSWEAALLEAVSNELDSIDE